MLIWICQEGNQIKGSTQFGKEANDRGMNLKVIGIEKGLKVFIKAEAWAIITLRSETVKEAPPRENMKNQPESQEKTQAMIMSWKSSEQEAS